MKEIDLVPLIELLGEKIIEICNCQYYFNDEKDIDDLGDLEIHTESTYMCFKLLSDGESIGLYKGKLKIPEKFNLNEEDKAHWKKEKTKELLLFQEKEIASFEKLIDFYKNVNYKVLSGIKINMTDGTYFVYYNNSDEAAISVNMIPKADTNEIDTYLEKLT